MNKPRSTANDGRSATLLISCPDQPGIIAAVTRFLSEHGGNILELDEHVDKEDDIFLMRLQWDLEEFQIPDHDMVQTFRPLAQRYHMSWRLHFSGHVTRMAVFVSRLGHCLHDILARHQAGEWSVQIPLIISNHQDLRPVAEHFDIAYHYLPIDRENKARQEARQLELLAEHGIDLIVLARYMQILTPSFVQQYPERIINIHHSFLPAFPGERPYHSAYRRGVKVIGATSHYVTAQLDEGPIIMQDITPVSHRDGVKDLIRKGKDLEKIVLARAVWAHLQHRVLVYNNRTAVFD